ncbi:MAG: SpoIIIAH-like family protein [Bacillota bacterium]
MHLLLVRKGLLSVIIAGLAIVFCLAFWRLGAAESDAPAVPVTVPVTVDDRDTLPAEKDFFVEYRMERERSRSRQVELLKDITSDPNAGQEAREKAQARLLEISRDMEREVSIENILRARGFGDAVVFFQGEMVTVVLPCRLTEEQTASVINIVSRGASAASENVMVITGVQ